MDFRKRGYVDWRRRSRHIAGSLTIALMLVVAWILTRGKFDNSDSVIPPEKKMAFDSRILEEMKRRLVKVMTYDQSGRAVNLGCGFIVGERGEVVANRHLFIGADKASLAVGEESFSMDSYCGVDENLDLVMLKGEALPPMQNNMKRSRKPPELSDNAFLFPIFENDQMKSVEGKVVGLSEIPPFGKVYQLTMPVGPDNQCAPVFNARGELIGIAGFFFKSNLNWCFAVPIENVMALMTTESHPIAELSMPVQSPTQQFVQPMQKGEFLFSQKRLAEAALFYDVAAARDPENAEAYFKLGWCLEGRDSEQAIGAYRKALALKPMLSQAHLRMGLACMESKSFHEAIASFKLASASAMEEELSDPSTSMKKAEKNPVFQECLLKLGECYIKQDMILEAIDILALGKRIGISNKGGLELMLGGCCLKMGWEPEALSFYTNAFRPIPGLAGPQKAFLYLLIKTRDWEKAESFVSQKTDSGRFLPKDPEMNFLIGLVHIGNGDENRALSQLKMVLNTPERNYQDELQQMIDEYHAKQGFRFDSNPFSYSGREPGTIPRWNIYLYDILRNYRMVKEIAFLDVVAADYEIIENDMHIVVRWRVLNPFFTPQVFTWKDMGFNIGSDTLKPVSGVDSRMVAPMEVSEELWAKYVIPATPLYTDVTGMKGSAPEGFRRLKWGLFNESSVQKDFRYNIELRPKISGESDFNTQIFEGATGEEEGRFYVFHFSDVVKNVRVNRNEKIMVKGALIQPVENQALLRVEWQAENIGSSEARIDWQDKFVLQSTYDIQYKPRSGIGSGPLLPGQTSGALWTEYLVDRMDAVLYWGVFSRTDQAWKCKIKLKPIKKQEP